MKILVTGAAGLVGSHVARRLAREHEVLALKHGDLDVTDRAAVRRCLLDEKPALIFNCAVLQVDDSERLPAQAQAVNVAGPGSWLKRRMISAPRSSISARSTLSTASRWGGGLIPLTTSHNPLNIYGRTKVSRRIGSACRVPAQFRRPHVLGLRQRQGQFSLHGSRRSQSRQESARHRRHLVKHDLCRRT